MSWFTTQYGGRYGNRIGYTCTICGRQDRNSPDEIHHADDCGWRREQKIMAVASQMVNKAVDDAWEKNRWT